jgi:hypothetical protein
MNPLKSKSIGSAEDFACSNSSENAAAKTEVFASTSGE